VIREYNVPVSGLKISQTKGYVLATSLLLLVVMAMLGVSMYGNVTVQEKMADNMRVKSRTLVAAKSAVQNNWRFEVLRDAMVSMGSTPTNSTEITDEYDDGNIDLSGEVSICYLGESQCAGTELNANPSDSTYMCKAFFAAGHITEAASQTSTTIEQAGFLLMLKSDDVPNCNAAQIDSSGTNTTNGSVAISIPSIDVHESLN